MSDTSNPTHSKFGGTWIDKRDFLEQLEWRLRTGVIDADMFDHLVRFERDGYIVLEGAASNEDIDRFESEISKAFREGHEHLIAQEPGSGAAKPVTSTMTRHGTRIVDSFAVIPAALDLFASPRLINFVAAVLDEKPLLFQSISFDTGSEQGLHQDTAYVVVDRPMEIIACWIALEDVKPGSGELQYMVGSHRLPDFHFGGARKHWDVAADGHKRHEEWFKWIVSEGVQRGMPIQKFMAKRGDILIWHADLAHGGSPIVDPSLTRKSLVGHFCPASAVPYFMKVSPNRATVLEHGPLAYSSWYYDLAVIDSDDRASYLQTIFGGITE